MSTNDRLEMAEDLGEALSYRRTKEEITRVANETYSTSSPFYFFREAIPFGRGARAAGAPEFASAHPALDVNAVGRDFPILKELVNGRPLIWLDTTTQKPQSVIDRLSHFYQHENSNIHRAAHELAARATDAYEESREKVRHFVNAPSGDEIVFLKGTTEAINLVAQSWGRQNVDEGDEVVITWLEHHANIVPWQTLCNEKGAKLRVVPVDDDGQILLEEYQKLLGPRTKLVSFSQVSNALGTVTPARQIIEWRTVSVPAYWWMAHSLSRTCVWMYSNWIATGLFFRP